MALASHRLAFPKKFRILRRSEFRSIYDEGVRFTGPYFAAFCLARAEQDEGPKVGFTVSRAFGKAVVRNRMKRRMREAVRHHLSQLEPRWAVVFNPRRPALTAPMEAIEREVAKLFLQCKAS